MSPEKNKEFDRIIRKFKRNLKNVVSNIDYPVDAMETVLYNTLYYIKDYPKRKKDYNEDGVL